MLLVRFLMHLFVKSSVLIKTGLYKRGTDPELDVAIDFHKSFQSFATEHTTKDIAGSFDRLAFLLRSSGASSV